MFHLPLPVLEKILRPVTTYLGLIVLLRVSPQYPVVNRMSGIETEATKDREAFHQR
jgi:hypothetical protein